MGSLKHVVLAMGLIACKNNCPQQESPPPSAAKVVQKPESADLVKVPAALGGISLFDCLYLGPPVIIDPGGQGVEAVGFGFKGIEGPYDFQQKPFARLDRFTPDKVTKDGKPVEGFAVTGTGMKGTVDVGGGVKKQLSGHDWIGVQFTGSLRCVNPDLLEDNGHGGKQRVSIPVTVEVNLVKEQPTSETTGGPGTPASAMTEVYGFALAPAAGQPVLHVPAIKPANHLCENEGDLAFPISGYLDADGKYVRDSTRFSFACAQRDLAKCLRGGYTTDAPTGSTIDIQTCTRMMTADYCGDGKSYTFDNTEIRYWDTDKNKPDHHEPLVFEAAWGPGGAVCLNHERWPKRFFPGTCKPPHCKDQDDAKTYYKDAPTIINESCMTHPCDKEGSGAAPPPPPGPQ